MATPGEQLDLWSMARTRREHDDPDLQDLADEALHQKLKRSGCVCGNERLPGRCPGPAHCPMVAREDAFGTEAHKLARASDPETSHEAAAQVATARLEREVYAVIARFPQGCIADDIANALPQHRRHSVVPRIAPLLAKGLIVDTGLKRRGETGRNQRVVAVAKP